jgi:diguanylate cyclase
MDLLPIVRFQTEVAAMGMDLSAVINHAAQWVYVQTDASAAIVELIEGDEMVYRAAAGLAKPWVGLRLNVQRSLSGASVLQRRVLSCADSTVDPRVDRAACEKIGLRSMVVAPLVHGQHALGVVKVYSHKANAFSEQTEELLAMVGEYLGAVVFYASKLGADEMFKQATRDHLTGLANRALFEDRARLAMAHAKRSGKSVGLLLLDLDDLKLANDSLGHHFGDQMLITLAKNLKAAAREFDTVARLGGDEFAMVIYGLNSATEFPDILDRIHQACDSEVQIQEQAHSCRASIGAALYPADGTTLGELLTLADQRMYQQKRDRKRMRA